MTLPFTPRRAQDAVTSLLTVTCMPRTVMMFMAVTHACHSGPPPAVSLKAGYSDEWQSMQQRLIYRLPTPAFSP